MKVDDRYLKTFGEEGVRYSDKFFTEENIAGFEKPPEELKKKEAKKPLPARRSVESVYESGWQTMMKNAQLKEAIENKGITQEEGFADFVKRRTEPLPADADEILSGLIKTDYARTLEDGKFVHRLDGEVILSIPVDAKSAKAISDNADALLCFAIVMLDLVLFVFAAAGFVGAMVDKGLIAKALMTPLQAFLYTLDQIKLVKLVDKVCACGSMVDFSVKASELICFLFQDLDEDTLSEIFTSVLEKIVSSWEWWEIALAVVQLIAFIFLIISTFGSSVIASVLGLIESVISLVLDVIKFIAALGYPTPEPPGELEPPVKPPEGVFPGYYIGNSNTLEVHNLYEVTPDCRYDEIKEDHKVKFGSFEDVYDAFQNKGYNGCAHCMPEYDNG